MSKGVLGYWKDLVPHGTPGWMAPFTLLLEVVGIFSKTIALIMRLVREHDRRTRGNPR